MPDPATTLRQAALRLLARREYSRAELARKLASQAESGEELVQVLDQLVAEQYLSDDRYARQRVQSRSKRYGDQRLQQELQRQGIASEAIDQALADGESELERCRAVWAKKFGQPAENAEMLAKQMRFLQYRGFSSESIRRVIRGVDE